MPDVMWRGWAWAGAAGLAAAVGAGLRIQVLGLGCAISAPGAPPGGGAAPAPVVECPVSRFLPDVPVAALLAGVLVLAGFAVVRRGWYAEAGLALAGLLVGGAGAAAIVAVSDIGCTMVQAGSYPPPPPRLWCPLDRYLLVVPPVALCAAALAVAGRALLRARRGGPATGTG